MKNIKNFIAGLFIGVALIIPGVIGGVIAIILGVYEKLIHLISDFKHQIKSDWKFFASLIFGLLVGIYLSSNVIAEVYIKYEVITKSVFLGLIIGGIPFIVKKLKNKQRKYDFNIYGFLGALGIGIGLYFLHQANIFQSNETFTNKGLLDTGMLLLAGFTYALGKIVPGISSSFMLMAIGMYSYVINIIAHPATYLTHEFFNVAVFTFGFIFGIVLLSKIILKLFNKDLALSYSIILGFIMGSTLILIPNYQLNNELFLSILFFITSFAISYLFSNYKNAKIDSVI